MADEGAAGAQTARAVAPTGAVVLFPDGSPQAKNNALAETAEAHTDLQQSTGSLPVRAGEEMPKDGLQPVSFFRLYTTADKADIGAILLGIAGALANAPTMPLFALLLGNLIDILADQATDRLRGQRIDKGEALDEINSICLWFVALAALTLVASFLEVGAFMWSGTRQVSRLRQRFLEASLKQEQAYYDAQATSGDVLSGLNEDCNAVQQAISDKVGNTIHHVGTFIASIVIAFVRGWKLTLVMVALLPLIAVCGAVIAKVTTSGGKVLSDAYAHANVMSAQAMANIRTIASFRAEEEVFRKYDEQLAYPRRVQVKVSTLGGMASGVVNGVIFFTYGTAFLYGNKLVHDEGSGYSAGIVLTVIFSTIIGGFSLGQAAPNFPIINTGRIAGARLFRVLDRTPAISLDKDGVVPDAPLQGNIELADIHFAYPARTDVRVFAGLSLSIAAGQTVALVGASGSGKSTIIQLLERFYDPARGAITVDGHDITRLSLAWYRDQVGLVSQEPSLFATSIRENIAMGREGAGEKEIVAAAKSANAHDFIAKLPQGYETQVGEAGVQLSGGQKQRVAIARALLKNPGILLLDEATSALDTVSERLVQAALERLAEGRTTIVVAHRLSTVRDADKIAVVQEGAIVEEGTHAELFAEEASVYHSLVKLQEQAMDQRAAHHGADAELELEPAPMASQAVLAVALSASQRRPSATGSRRSLDPGARRASGAVVTGARHSQDLNGGKAVVTTNGEGKNDDLTEEEKAVKVKFGRLLGLVSPDWPWIVFGVLASMALGAVMPLFAFMLGDIVSNLNPAKPESEGNVFAIAFFALGAGIIVIGTIQGLSFAVVGANLARLVRQKFFRSVLYQEVGWFDEDANTSGALSSKLSSDAPSVRGAVSDVMGMAVQNTTTFVAAYIIAFYYGWRMTLVITAVLPLLVFSSVMQMKFFTGLDNKGQTLFARANQTAHEAVLALRTVASFNMQRQVARLYQKLLAVPNQRALRNALLSGLAFGSGQCILFLFYALAFWYGGTEYEAGRLDLGSMMKVLFSILLASMGITQAQLAFPDVAKGKSAVARIFRVVDRQPKIDASSHAGEAPVASAGAVELRGVTFTYPTRPDVHVFRDFSLAVAPGKITALVGESGSGKSTIVALIERFYDVSAGHVLVDGHDVRQLSLSWLRSQVGLVSQEPALFNGTVLDNLRLGKPGASLAEVQAACDVANARTFIERQPGKYDTLLGEGGGISLSGGQKQRIAIARAVLKDPRILLLDEATSALDAESERLVQDALDKLMVGRTSIVIAHRLTTIRNADSIAVVQHGQVLEHGSHDELMAKGSDGAYVKLARAQAGRG